MVVARGGRALRGRLLPRHFPDNPPARSLSRLFSRRCCSRNRSGGRVFFKPEPSRGGTARAKYRHRVNRVREAFRVTLDRPPDYDEFAARQKFSTAPPTIPPMPPTVLWSLVTGPEFRTIIDHARPHQPPVSCTARQHRLQSALVLKGLAASGAAAVHDLTGLFPNPVFAASREGAKKAAAFGCAWRRASLRRGIQSRPSRRRAGRSGSSRPRSPAAFFFRSCRAARASRNHLEYRRCMHTNRTEHLQGINLLTRGQSRAAPAHAPTLGAAVSACAEGLDTTRCEIHILPSIDPNPEGTIKRIQASDLTGGSGRSNAPGAVGVVSRSWRARRMRLSD